MRSRKKPLRAIPLEVTFVRRAISRKSPATFGSRSSFVDATSPSGPTTRSAGRLSCIPHHTRLGTRASFDIRRQHSPFDAFVGKKHCAQPIAYVDFSSGLRSV